MPAHHHQHHHQHPSHPPTDGVGELAAPHHGAQEGGVGAGLAREQPRPRRQQPQVVRRLGVQQSYQGAWERGCLIVNWRVCVPQGGCEPRAAAAAQAHTHTPTRTPSRLPSLTRGADRVEMELLQVVAVHQQCAAGGASANVRQATLQRAGGRGGRRVGGAACARTALFSHGPPRPLMRQEGRERAPTRVCAPASLPPVACNPPHLITRRAGPPSRCCCTRGRCWQVLATK